MGELLDKRWNPSVNRPSNQHDESLPSMKHETNDVLSRLSTAIEERKHQDAKSSYTSSLFSRGEDAILQKVGEEAVEFILAAKGDDRGHLVSEAADVWFHMLVLLSHKGLDQSHILNELQRREGTSGHAEKASRPIDNTN